MCYACLMRRLIRPELLNAAVSNSLLAYMRMHSQGSAYGQWSSTAGEQAIGEFANRVWQNVHRQLKITVLTVSVPSLRCWSVAAPQAPETGLRLCNMKQQQQDLMRW